MSLLNRIDQVMEDKGITDREICLHTGLTLMTVYNARKGKNVTLETADLIAKALGETLDGLFYREEQEEEAA
jgi:transcriptional regulator with XRE-family HTH domain